MKLHAQPLPFERFTGLSHLLCLRPAAGLEEQLQTFWSSLEYRPAGGVSLNRIFNISFSDCVWHSYAHGDHSGLAEVPGFDESAAVYRLENSGLIAEWSASQQGIELQHFILLCPDGRLDVVASSAPQAHELDEKSYRLRLSDFLESPSKEEKS